MKPFFAALRFLSILPVPQTWTGDVKHLSLSVKYFCVAGLLMAAIAAACAQLFSFFLIKYFSLRC